MKFPISFQFFFCIFVCLKQETTKDKGRITGWDLMLLYGGHRSRSSTQDRTGQLSFHCPELAQSQSKMVLCSSSEQFFHFVYSFMHP